MPYGDNITSILMITIWNLTLVQHNYCNGNKFEKSLPNDNKLNERRITNQLCMFRASLQLNEDNHIQQQLVSSNVKGEYDANTELGLAWTNRNPEKSCQYVLPNDQCNGKNNKTSVFQVSKADACDESRENCYDLLILVEKISKESDRLRIQWYYDYQ
ncbi:981_t:CDS:2 [Funneliformis geosporum]|uniref:994_t:CDS:1 n=1 Tax=Funneliformis geosporum TaxID=1117311 RepID=A0A9W4SQL1_9GLOM|nr:981_t:CDS:2 [Funneliformis geosporum]CAI2178035.1 994_t:CDS:2 [Funneliformis geosporum]